MTPDDVLYRFRVRTLALAEELGNVRAACRAMGIHHSTFYRWRATSALRSRDAATPRAPLSWRAPAPSGAVCCSLRAALGVAGPGGGRTRISFTFRRKG